MYLNLENRPAIGEAIDEIDEEKLNAGRICGASLIQWSVKEQTAPESFSPGFCIVCERRYVSY